MQRQSPLFFIWQLFFHGHPVTIFVTLLTTPDNLANDLSSQPPPLRFGPATSRLPVNSEIISVELSINYLSLLFPDLTNHIDTYLIQKI